MFLNIYHVHHYNPPVSRIIPSSQKRTVNLSKGSHIFQNSTLFFIQKFIYKLLEISAL